MQASPGLISWLLTHTKHRMSSNTHSNKNTISRPAASSVVYQVAGTSTHWGDNDVRHKDTDPYHSKGEAHCWHEGNTLLLLAHPQHTYMRTHQEGREEHNTGVNQQVSPLRCRRHVFCIALLRPVPFVKTASASCASARQL